MPINITNIISVVNTKLAAIDSSTDPVHVKLLNTADDYINNVGGVITYDSFSDLPSADSSSIGRFVFAGDASDSAGLHIDDRSLYINTGTWNKYDDGPRRDPIPEVAVVYGFQGETSGYISGGQIFPTVYTTIDKHPFASDGNASAIPGTLTVARRGAAGQSSADHGYTSGGRQPTNTGMNVVDKFPFAADTAADDVGDLTVTRNQSAGQSSTENGYNSGGDGGGAVNVIDKFSFAADGHATDVGDMSVTSWYDAGCSSLEEGFTVLGYNTTPSLTYHNMIEKFPFASDANTSDHGDATTSPNFSTIGISSAEYGYRVSSRSYDGEKFSFASNVTATSLPGHMIPGVSPLTYARAGAGSSSLTEGFSYVGGVPTGNQMTKFPFANDNQATAVGDLSTNRTDNASQQV